MMIHIKCSSCNKMLCFATGEKEEVVKVNGKNKKQNSTLKAAGVSKCNKDVKQRR